ncbi:MOSC domain-containing protein [Planomonospora sp. ID91781]|uniref:MOSC domain-containing protein n=1 Tax=Planomonospora sphaerica TaxID=161355 RepID=A0A171DQG7_9ACTN|nr:MULTISPECIES: MOSC domain-containing protein [Planomonospora]MBG0823268.1 MOSC domain-containing protein [Planomonospora sp. ID91781]GAT71310.1 MOSC domain-containing protein [Planomonospora sphaerica]
MTALEPGIDARVLAVHIGTVADLPYRGRTIRSAFVKRETSGPVTVTTLGLCGDEQGDRAKHGGPDKAVCLFPAEHYPHYESRLGRRLDRPAFGENLTTCGLLEDDLCIGDVLRIGTALCEVSVPRNPCFRIGARHGATEFVLWMEHSGLTGCYLRVLRTGQVTAGCRIELIHRPHPDATVAEANRVMHRDRGDRPTIRRLLTVPQLGAAWRRTLSRRIATGTAEDQTRRRYGPLPDTAQEGPA